MKRAVVILLGITALTVSGCSSVSTSFDYDNHVDFSKLQTFAWMPREANIGGNAQQAQMDNSLFSNRLKNAVNSNLEAKGYSINTADPDFVIIYHTGVQDKVNVTNWGYTYGPYWGPWGESLDVHQYTEGTLILDFIDFETKNIIWRGTAQKALSGEVDPEKVDANIQKAVDQLLAKFPPQ
ncbi:MAG: DUF4136 domain-containing protein [Candidatus Krumholzibacteria bacterium]|nr:DUF4136 domain-containing protein [Candidatus Krumholzibacteria bacterium]